MRFKSRLPMSISWVLLVFMSGCMSFSTLQTAEPVTAGHGQIGLGTIVVNSGKDWVIMPEISGRAGVVNNLDLGIKYTLFGAVTLDGKYRFLNEGVDGAFDLAWSTSTAHAPATVNGFYPMILFGQKHWYAGIKGIYLTTKGSVSLWNTDISLNSSGYADTDFIFGGVVGGDEIRGLFEVNAYLNNEGKVQLIPAIGLAFSPF